MRAIYILPFLFIIVINGCTTIEVAKEVTKATKIVKTTIDEITDAKEEINEEETEELEIIIKEKEEIAIEREKEEAVATKQKKIVPIKLLGKTLNQLTQELGNPELIREDGNTQIVRFDTLSCRLFIYFDILSL